MIAMRPRDLAAFVAIALLGGCDLAPAYHPTTMALPDDYAGAGPFQRAHPADAIPRGPWWTSYGNPTIDALEARLPANPDLAAYAEQYRQARDLAAIARSGLYPHVGAEFDMAEDRESQRTAFRSPTSTAPLEQSHVQGDGQASWEIDIWQAITNETRAQERLAQATNAGLASFELSLQAELAGDYVALRGLDAQMLLYRETINYYAEGLHITTLRLDHLIGSGLDVGRAQSQLSSAEAALLDVEARRAIYAHAIAALIGIPAGSLVLPPQEKVALVLPTIPTGVPSALLQRRPDIAQAERRMAAANAEIGVARAAFFPNVSIGAVAGEAANSFDLVTLPNSLWSVGSTFALPLFEGGQRTAQLDRTRAYYRQTRDDYRAAVLAAMQDVEDQLSNVGLLSVELARQKEAVAAAGKVQNLALQLYQAGADNYLDVVVAQVTALSTGVTEIDNATRLAQSSVGLVRALGGGWTTAQLPDERRIPPFDPLVPGPG